MAMVAWLSRRIHLPEGADLDLDGLGAEPLHDLVGRGLVDPLDQARGRDEHGRALLLRIPALVAHEEVERRHRPVGDRFQEATEPAHEQVVLARLHQIDGVPVPVAAGEVGELDGGVATGGTEAESRPQRPAAGLA